MSQPLGTMRRVMNLKIPEGDVYKTIQQTKTADVRTPSGRMDKPIIETNPDGTLVFKYEPSEEGEHQIIVKRGGEHVKGSPLRFQVDTVIGKAEDVTAYGPGLIKGIAGKTNSFTVKINPAHVAGLSFGIEGPKKAPISCHNNSDGTVTVTYQPSTPGDYKVTVKFADKHIRGSPFPIRVSTQ